MDDMDRRIRHVSQQDQITPAQAEQKIRKMEKMRAAYYNSRTDSRWGAAENYDLCLNISRIGRERALHIILDGFGTKVSETGRGAGKAVCICCKKRNVISEKSMQPLRLHAFFAA